MRCCRRWSDGCSAAEAGVMGCGAAEAGVMGCGAAEAGVMECGATEAGVMGCGAAEVTDLSFVFFYFIYPRVLSANRVDFGLFFFVLNLPILLPL